MKRIFKIQTKITLVRTSTLSTTATCHAVFGRLSCEQNRHEITEKGN